MKHLILALAALLLAGEAQARDVYVQGHTRSDGGYVEPYHRTSPDSSYQNNYEYQGNYNPYSGNTGTRSDDSYNQPGMRGANHFR